MGLATHFISVTNMSEPLITIPVSETGQGLVRLLNAPQVATRLKKIKKPFSRVDGDIPKGVVTAAAVPCPFPWWKSITIASLIVLGF